MNSPASQLLPHCLALHRQGKLREAMDCYVQVLRGDPENSEALYYVAVVAVQEGKFAEGIKLAQRALTFGPPQARVHNLLGQALLRLSQAQEALASFDRAIELQPDFAEAYGNRANALIDLGRAEDALASFERVLALRPDSWEDWCNLANLLAELGQAEAALAGYDNAIALRPNHAAIHFNRAKTQVALNRLAEALAGLDQAIAIAPDFAEAYSDRGLVLAELNRLEEAVASFDRALALKADFPSALSNRGNILRQLGHFVEAETDYTRAIKIDPKFSAAHLGHGHLLLERGLLQEARAAIERAKVLDTTSFLPSSSLAILQLLTGDWKEGWENYENRHRTPKPAYFPLPYPRWLGGPLNGDRLVVMAEQGLGDVIQFCRFVPILAERGLDVTFLAGKNMAALLSTLANAKIASTIEELERDARPIRWVPLMSLPSILGLRPNSIPANAPYLAAQSERIAIWRQRLAGGAFKIGIAWQPGSPPNWYSNKRIVPLAAFAPLVEIPQVKLIVLQKGNGIEQIAAVPFRNRIETLGNDFDSGPDAFLDTAAVMMNLDLVVSCDTSIGHLAGALARPVFLALASLPDWRWLLDRDDTPWYPTMRLFRQKKPGDWTEVFERIAAEVRALIDRS